MLHVRSIAVSAAVVCFFVLSIIGTIGGLSPCACCKRAMLGAMVAYIAAGMAGRAINAVLIQAMIDNEMTKEAAGDAKS